MSKPNFVAFKDKVILKSKTVLKNLLFLDFHQMLLKERYGKKIFIGIIGHPLKIFENTFKKGFLKRTFIHAENRRKISFSINIFMPAEDKC